MMKVELRCHEIRISFAKDGVTEKLFLTDPSQYFHAHYDVGGEFRVKKLSFLLRKIYLQISWHSSPILIKRQWSLNICGGFDGHIVSSIVVTVLSLPVLINCNQMKLNENTVFHIIKGTEPNFI